MRTKVTLLLLFLNVVLFYAIFYLRNDTVPDTDTSLVLGRGVNDARSLSITTANGGKVTLERKNDIWVITEPTAWTANDFAVRYILNELHSLRAETTFNVDDLAKTGQTLADYGLEKAPITLTLQPAGDAAPITLPIGDSTKGGNRLYVLSPDGKRIHVVKQSLAERLSLSLNELRSEVLFNIPVFEAQALTLEGAPGQRTLFRRDGERWNIETLQTLASRVDTELAISGLTSLRLQSFVPKEQAEGIQNSITNSSLRITLEGNHRRETLLIGGAAPSVPGTPPLEGATLRYARMEDDPARSATPFILPVPNALFRVLQGAQRELREKRLLAFDPASVSAINIKADEAELTLQRIDSAASSTNAVASWQLVSRRGDTALPTIAADTAIVDVLLRDLSRLSADEFTNDAPSQSDRENYGFTRPSREVTLTFSAKGGTLAQPPIILLIASGSDHQTYASLANREPVYRVTGEIINELPAQRLYYRERVVRSLPDGAQITALRLEDLSTSRQILNTPLPVAPGADKSEAITTVATELRKLQARTFLADAFGKTAFVNGAERPWRYRLDATLNLVGGSEQQTESYTLFLTDRGGGTSWVAGSPSANVVFTLAPPLLDALFSLTYEPRTEVPASEAPAQAIAPAPTPTPAPAP